MRIKACSVCDVEKARTREFFYASGIAKDGLSPRCILCDKKMSDARRALHRESAAQTARDWRAKNPERNRAAMADWVARNGDHIRQVGLAYRQKNAERRSEYMREWREANPEKSRDSSGARRLAVEQATPAWLTAAHYAEMRRIYKLRDRLALETGQPHEVDHVVPLRNKRVCGLHVPWNLRVTTKEVNQRKRNYLEEHHATAQA